jgi:hypothetical protein
VFSGSSPLSLRRKLFWPAPASISVPSTVNCSSDRQIPAPRLLYNQGKELLGYRTLQQSVAIFSK